MLQFLEVISILAKSNFKPLNFVLFLVLDDSLHAYYTIDQTTFLYKEQNPVDGLARCKQKVRME
jgi:hypothetical protein